MGANPVLPAIAVNRHDANERFARLRAGMMLDAVRHALGGPEFETERQADGTVRFWRFRLVDADLPAREYEIYRAEFTGERFVGGAVLPQG
jgi:hypothetical protein